MPGRAAECIRLLHVNESDTVLGPGVGRPVQEIPRDAAGKPLFTPEEAEYNVRRKRCDCPLGRGIPDWPRILQAGSAVQAYIVERRWSYLPDPCACFAEDLAYLKTL